MTWVIQQYLAQYLEEHGLSYQRLAECLGALAGAEHDFVRRVVNPYERSKQRINGDVWPGRLMAGLSDDG